MIMRHFRLLFITLVLASCQTNQYTALSTKVTDLENDIANLKQQYAVLNSSMSKQEARIKELSSNLETIRVITHKEIIQTCDESNTNNYSKEEYKNKQRTNSKQSNKRIYTSIKNTYSGRCQAITKKGTQCKRNAKIGSKYCWQHGG